MAVLTKKEIDRRLKRADTLSVDELAQLLEGLSDHYYHGDALVSDEQFDRLRERLASLVPGHAFLQTVGSQVRSDRQKCALPFVMGSLDKWKAEDPSLSTRLRTWANAHPGPYTVSSKLDGSSCLVVWQRQSSKWTPRLCTRGDGRVGTDLGHLSSFLLPAGMEKALSALFPETDQVAVRGELLVRKDVFARKYAATMSRPRSLVNGVVNRKEVDATLARDIDLVLYEVVSPRLPKSDQMRRLAGLGMRVVDAERTVELTPEGLLRTLREHRNRSVYDLDGLVIEAEGPYMASTTRTPEYALAFKAAEEAVSTRVVAVHWNASKDGLWKPIVEYEPVVVAGTVLRNATGFTGQYVQRHGLGPGAVIRVHLGGDVVPQIQAVDAPAPGGPQFPPVGEYVWDGNGVELRLPETVRARNPAFRRAQLKHFVTTLGVEHLNEGVLKKLQESGHDTVAGLLRLTVGDVAKIPGMGKVSAERLVTSLREKTQDVPLSRLMAASNMFGRGFAEKKLQRILDVFPRVLHVRPTEAELVTVDGVEQKTAERFLVGRDAFLSWLSSVPSITWKDSSSAPRPSSGPWTGRVYVFTGFRPSEAVQAAIRDRGATVEERVTKKTTHLVTKESGLQTAKAMKARELGIHVQSENSFLEE